MNPFKKAADWLVRFCAKLESNLFLTALRKGLMSLIPFLLTGAFALAIHNFPIPAVKDFIQTFWGGYPDKMLLYLYDATMGMISILLLITASYHYVAQLKPGKPYLHILATTTSVAVFVASFGLANGNFHFSYFGALGLFYAILTSFISVRLFLLLQAAFSRRKQYAAGADENFNISITALFAFLVIGGAFAIFNLLLNFIFDISSFIELIRYLFSLAFSRMGNNFFSALLFLFLQQVLWFFGIHGGNVLEDIALNVFSSDYGHVYTKSFFDTFTALGGGGATLCLIIAMLIFSRSRTNKKLSLSASAPALFNINEPLIFGLPVILNPIMLIPFVLTPIVCLITGSIFFETGLLSITNPDVAWTAPVFISGYQATGSVLGIILQLLNIALGVLIYWPFVRLSEYARAQRNDAALLALKKAFFAERDGENKQDLLTLAGDTGTVARALVSDFKVALQRNEVALYYQPQMDAAGRIAGAEALLRWRLNGKFLPPDLLIRLAEEEGISDALNHYIIDRWLSDLAELKQRFPHPILLSMNLNPEMLRRRKFVEEMAAKITAFRPAPLSLCLELTENAALTDNPESKLALADLMRSGLILAVDDFSMGNTSIKYLQRNTFAHVKLDGGIVRDFARNERSGDIIASVIRLGKKLNFTVTAEYVESEELFQKLKKLGCDYFQGFHFSPALTLDEFIQFAETREVAPEPRKEE